ncbi:MAG: 3-oxoacyl-[acyl-carrier-protein] synthase III C-terminal domain-containing protein, partial [Planctomycetota bacterium]|nr:3-oxoacyl-[acyl-carrier-protein] synthase III C-terminal domain-containing protein [Planctomycetota bacterium]
VHADEATDVIGLALFGDGAFAAVLRSGDVEGGSGRPARLLASAETWCPNTGDMATVTGRGNALAPDLSPELPEMVEVELVRAIHALLEAQGISPDRLAGYIMHVGSKPMLEQLARKLGVGKAGLAHSFEVLRHHGNNSAASVIYALERTLASGAPGLYVLAAPGPGMCMATVLVEVG